MGANSVLGRLPFRRGLVYRKEKGSQRSCHPYKNKLPSVSSQVNIYHSLGKIQLTTNRNSSQKIDLDMSCKLSPRDNLHEYQSLFSGKNNRIFQNVIW